LKGPFWAVFLLRSVTFGNGDLSVVADAPQSKLDRLVGFVLEHDRAGLHPFVARSRSAMMTGFNSSPFG
jgi:hypothetical protein